MSLNSVFNKFRKSHEGSLSVEAVIVLPMLLWAIGAMFVYWDAYKSHSLNVKAAYTLGDLVSREEDPIDQAYIDGLDKIFDFLIKDTTNKDIRVTIVNYTQEDDDAPIVKELDWSEATGTLTEYVSISDLEDEIPLLNPGETLIVVETEMFWEPPFKWDLFSPGLDEMTMRHRVFMMPRTAQQVVWAGA